MKKETQNTAGASASNFSEDLIAPCGMNCNICQAHLREKNRCYGCTYAEQNIPISRAKCKMRNCTKRKGKFCYDCPEFPCERVKHMDKRYRTKYGMSEIENLNAIKKNGLEKFMKSEETKWKCPNCEGIICCHDGKCYSRAVK